MKKHSAIEQLQKRIKYLEKQIELVKMLPEHPMATFHDGNVRIPFNWQIFKEYRQAMGKGWRMGEWLRTHHSDDSVSQHTIFTHPDIGTFRLALDTSYEGASCQKVQVGTKEVPVYEVVCE